jgi:hypothetical protein
MACFDRRFFDQFIDGSMHAFVIVSIVVRMMGRVNGMLALRLRQFLLK